MARKSKSRRRAGGRSGGPLRAFEQAATLPRRLDAKVEPVAAAIGWVGVVAIAALAVLAFLPDDTWPFGMERARLPIYGTIALVLASLLGWTFMQNGQARIERRIGRRASLWAFAILPLVAAIVTFAVEHAFVAGATHGTWSVVVLTARWYAPTAVVVSVAAFLSAKSGRRRTLLVYVALLAPFGALVLALVFGFRLPFIDASLHETLRSLGSGAVALQILLAWFVGGT